MRALSASAGLLAVIALVVAYPLILAAVVTALCVWALAHRHRPAGPPPPPDVEWLPYGPDVEPVPGKFPISG